METHVIQAVRLTDADHPPPLRNFRRRVTGKGKDVALECPAQEDRPTVDNELRALRGELPHAKGDDSFITVLSALKSDLQLIDIRRNSSHRRTPLPSGYVSVTVLLGPAAWKGTDIADGL